MNEPVNRVLKLETFNSALNLNRNLNRMSVFVLFVHEKVFTGI